MASEAELRAAIDALAQCIQGQLQTFTTGMLLAILHGEADMIRLASQEIANRGLDGDGRWVGFKQAEAEHQNRSKP